MEDWTWIFNGTNEQCALQIDNSREEEEGEKNAVQIENQLFSIRNYLCFWIN